jgi:hypothetical protein
MESVGDWRPGGGGGKMRNQDSHLAKHRESRSVARDQRTLLREFNAPHGCCWRSIDGSFHGPHYLGHLSIGLVCITVVPDDELANSNSLGPAKPELVAPSFLGNHVLDLLFYCRIQFHLRHSLKTPDCYCCYCCSCHCALSVKNTKTPCIGPNYDHSSVMERDPKY